MYGLLSLGVFTVVNKEESRGHRTYGSIFVDQVKDEGFPTAFEKYRIVVQEFNDKHHQLMTYAPTVQRASQRLLLSIFTLDPELQLFSRDISQAYVQAETNIKRPIFVRPPQILGIPEDLFFRADRPLYGIPEPGIHWFLTYYRHHTEKLGMKPSTHDSCFLLVPKSMGIYYCSTDRPRGFTFLQTDDTLNSRNNRFMDDEKDAAVKFDCKPINFLKDGG